MSGTITIKSKISRIAYRATLATALRLAILAKDTVKADAIRNAISESDTNEAEAKMLLQAHERDRRNKRKK